MMQQNRDRNGRPRNTRPYDLNRDVARTSAPSQDHTPRSTGSSRYGYNGEPLSRPPSRSANGSVRSSRADNSIQFPTQPQSQTRRPAQGQGSNTTQYPAGSRRRAADQKTRSPAANSAARQTMPAAAEQPEKPKPPERAKPPEPAATGQAARTSACARRRLPRSKALPAGKSAKSAR